MIHPVRVLVVDDESVVRDFMMDILTACGYAVEVVPSGAEALERLQGQDDIGVVLTDVVMPEMNGIELIRALRTLRPDIVPVVMTGFATLETARDAVREGAYDYILKPFNPTEIRTSIGKALERRHLMDENLRLRELAWLFEFSEALACIHDERVLVQFVLRAALTRTNAERGSLLLALPGREGLVIAADAGLPEGMCRERVRLDTGIAGWVARHGRSLLVEDLDLEPELAPLRLGLAERSFVSVPLVGRIHRAKREPLDVESNVIGIMNVTMKSGGGAFTQADLKMLNLMAEQVAGAIENIRLIHDIEDSHLSTLKSLALLLEARDRYTHGHSQRVRHYCLQAGRHFGLSEEALKTLELGAVLHDIGKIGLDDALLNKPGAFDEREWQAVKRHPVVGYDVLVPVGRHMPGVLELVRSHHERPDGRGYPDGLKGDALSLPVRIIAVADAYDAMSTDRAYRPSLSQEHILGELRRCSGTQFDAAVAQFFIAMIECGAFHPSRDEAWLPCSA